MLMRKRSWLSQWRAGEAGARGHCLCLYAARHSRSGHSGGFSFWLQDRSGGSVDFLDQNLQKFLAAARKRPELAGVNSLFSAAAPQIYVDVDRDKVLKQGVAVADYTRQCRRISAAFF